MSIMLVYQSIGRSGVGESGLSAIVDRPFVTESPIDR